MSTIERFAENVVMPPNSTVFSASRPNVAVHVFDITSAQEDTIHQLVYGMTVEKPADVNGTAVADSSDVTFYRFPLAVDEYFANGSSISDGAIIMSREAFEIGRRQYGNHRADEICSRSVERNAFKRNTKLGMLLTNNNR